jgi:DNA polymerase (family 10)
MDKGDVADILEEIALLLELKGDNPFKTRAYSSAARTIDSLTEDLATLVRKKRLGEIKGLGDALQDKVTQLVTTGSLSYYDELKASIPPGQLEMLDIPGLGPKKIIALNKELQITDIPALEAACKDGRVAGLKGFGEKTATNLLSGIEQNRLYSSQHRYGDVIGLAEDLVDTLRTHPDVTRISLAGSLRRGKEVIKDMDIVASSKNPKAVMDAFVSLPGVVRVTNHGETKSSILLKDGLACDLRVVSDAQFPYALHHFTGSKEHNVALRQRAISRGLKMSEWGLFDEAHKTDGQENGPLVVCRTEEEIFKALDLDFVPPELRENLGEIEIAEANTLPRLLEWSDLRGCFHNHTVASDGKNTLEEMAQAAEDIGLEYLGIADHSKSSFQANGLDEARILEQQKDIAALNQKLGDRLRIFSGVEVDILKDGSLDYDDSVMKTFDYTVASVHSVFNLSEDEMTARVIRAMENPYVTMLGHLTGRLLLSREAYKINHNKIIDCAAATGTWIELNANPRRLDMDWRWWRKARDQGVLCVINPDAHRTHHFGFLKIGVNIARKGWLRKSDVANTRNLEQVKTLLAKKSGRAFSE